MTRENTSNTDGGEGKSTGQSVDDTDRFEIWACDDCGISFGYPREIVVGAWKCPKCGSEGVQNQGG